MKSIYISIIVVLGIISSGYASQQYWQHGTEAGSTQYLKYGTGPGSIQFLKQGTTWDFFKNMCNRFYGKPNFCNWFENELRKFILEIGFPKNQKI